MIKIFRLMKLIRVFQVFSLITNSNLSQERKGMIRAVLIVVLLFFLAHAIACLLYTVVYRDPIKNWIPPTDFGDISTDIFYIKDYDKKEVLVDFTGQTDYLQDTVFKFFKSMYHATLIFNMVDIAPRTETAILFTCFIFIGSAILNAYLFGEFSNLLGTIKQEQNDFIEQLDTVNSIMSELKMPRTIRDDVLRHVRETHRLSCQQQEFQDFIEKLKPTLRTRVRVEMIVLALKRSPFLLKLQARYLAQEFKIRLANRMVSDEEFQIPIEPSATKIEKLVR